MQLKSDNTINYNHKCYDKEEEEICHIYSNCTSCPENKYLVLGDNRSVSKDSRILGFIDKKDIEGSVEVSLWPIKIVK